MKIKSENKVYKIPINTPKGIIKEVCKEFGVKEEELLGSKKAAILTFARIEVSNRMLKAGFNESSIAQVLHKANNSVRNYRKFRKI